MSVCKPSCIIYQGDQNHFFSFSLSLSLSLPLYCFELFYLSLSLYQSVQKTSCIIYQGNPFFCPSIVFNSFICPYPYISLSRNLTVYSFKELQFFVLFLFLYHNFPFSLKTHFIFLYFIFCFALFIISFSPSPSYFFYKKKYLYFLREAAKKVPPLMARSLTEGGGD